MANYNKRTKIFIGNGTNTGTSIGGIKKGDLFLVDKSGTILTAAAATALSKNEEVRVAYGFADGKPVLSDPIRGSYTSKYLGTSYSAPVEGILYVGYNGTSGTLEADVDQGYRLNVFINDDVRAWGQSITKGTFDAAPSATATQKSIASEISQKYYFEEFGDRFMADKVKLEVTSNGTRAAFAGDATVVKGSPYVSFSAPHTLAVGDVVKFQGITYFVIGVPSTTQIKLQMPYQGISETIALADADSGVYTAITAYGFKLTGIAQEELLPEYDEYTYMNFSANYVKDNEIGTEVAAAVTVSAVASEGQGFWKQVKRREIDTNGYLGDLNRQSYDSPRIPLVTVEGESYDSIVIHYSANREAINFDYNSFVDKQIEIYIPDGSAQGTDAADNFLAVMNNYFGTVVGLGDITF